MIADIDMQLAMRTRALTLSVATTGAISLAATSTGFTRAAGSFYTDGLWPGMEIVASGFGNAANNGTGVITEVTSATAIKVTMYTSAYVNGMLVVTRSATVAEGAAGGRTLAVGLPSLRAWENVNFAPESGIPFVEEQFIPGPMAQVTMGPNGDLEVLPQYSLQVNLPSGTGLTPARYTDALRRLFPPRAFLTLANGDVLRVRQDVGPFVGQLQQSQPGFAVKPITIPFRLRTANSI